LFDSLYHYRATVTKVYDGDTITVSVDLGMNFYRKKIKLRLHEINAPELRGDSLAEGRKSRDYLRSLILNKDVIIQTLKDKKGKYGRYLAKVWVELDEKWVCVNSIMVNDGYAIHKKY
tara:strand:- start:1080 stop:1433 length:354 start_codon:yes stop_codon:yes gene_type:complete